MSANGHEELSELLAVYSLDALPAQEQVQLEQHLADCPRCRSELASLQAVAGMLGNASANAPTAPWQRISAELGFSSATPPPPIAFPTLRRPSRARAWRVAVLGLAAVALAVVGVLGYRVVDLNNQVGKLQSALSDRGMGQLVAFALANPAHRTIELTSAGGSLKAEVVLLPDGRAYWIEGDLSALPAGRTYQLWAVSAGKVVSLGVLGRSPRDIAFLVEPVMTKLMVTAEPSGGVPAPTASPLIAAAL